MIKFSHELLDPKIKEYLLIETSEAPYETLENVLEKSEKFPLNFPVQTGRCKNLQLNVDKKLLTENILSTYPIILEDTLVLYVKFILYKQLHGSEIEKKIFKGMTITKLVQRFLEKRAAVFMGVRDRYKLLDGSAGKIFYI